MKKYLLSLILAITALTVNAEYDRLLFFTTGGDVQSVGLTNLKITFTDTEMTASSSENVVKIALVDLQTMAFAGDVVGVDFATAADKEPVSVYAIDGSLKGHYDSLTEAATSLPSGVFIFKTESGITAKLMIKR